MKYVIDRNVFFNELEERGISTLFHANSVETSLSFFRVGSLLSRAECQRQSLHQSSQWTDASDQTHGIFDDIFLNFNDFHRLFGRVNQYGPILFEVNVADLKSHLANTSGASIHLTKSQPHKWVQTTRDEEKWRQDLTDLFIHPKDHSLRSYVNGWPDVVLSGLGSPGLPLTILRRVVVDENPNNMHFFSQVKTAFESCLNGLGISLPIVSRSCSRGSCGCRSWKTVQKAANEYKYESGRWTNTYGKIS